jgi:hypothetical protein
MKNNKVIEIRITYNPEEVENEESLNDEIRKFLEEIKSKQGVKLKAKRHIVELDYMPDEYGLE